MIALFSIGLSSCSKDETASPEELKDEIGNLPGLGDMGGTPQGTPFSLPDGITIVGEISGSFCEDATFRIGSGTLVVVCLELRNDTDKEITVTFPAGLVLISGTDKYQHGVMLRTEEITIPPNEAVRFALHTYCGNSGRSAADSDAVYTFGPITNSKLIARLIDDLTGKKINAVDYFEREEFSDDYYTEQTKVQTLLWFITEDRGLDWATFEGMYKELLGQVPNKK